MRQGRTAPGVPTNIPVDHFTVSEFTERINITRFSEVLERDVEEVECLFHCPKCFKVQDFEPEHGKKDSCECGLHWISYGNGLYVWKFSKNPIKRLFQDKGE
jgi:hypothetical protein